MKTIYRNFIVIVAILLLLTGFNIESIERDLIFNDKYCKTVKVRMIGKITWLDDNSHYPLIRINNEKETYLFDITKIKETKGFPSTWISYKVGDSIIKKANSREVMIKRGNNYAVYILTKCRSKWEVILRSIFFF